VHDQLIINIPEENAEEVAKMVQYLMENTTVLEGVTLKAPPAIAKNFRDGH
jgi:DNA polymerase I-like protein with 3'-5' exonuclease and polymerase domains